jgi:hypothetical protein
MCASSVPSPNRGLTTAGRTAHVVPPDLGTSRHTLADCSPPVTAACGFAKSRTPMAPLHPQAGAFATPTSMS